MNRIRDQTYYQVSVIRKATQLSCDKIQTSSFKITNSVRWIRPKQILSLQRSLHSSNAINMHNFSLYKNNCT